MKRIGVLMVLGVMALGCSEPAKPAAPSPSSGAADPAAMMQPPVMPAGATPAETAPAAAGPTDTTPPAEKPAGDAAATPSEAPAAEGEAKPQ